MRGRHRYRPVGWDGLEARVALTHGGPIAPGLIGTLSPHPAAAGKGARVIAQVNATFDQFTADYQQAQAAYLSSGTASDSTTAFTKFTHQEVNLLAQQLTRTLSRVPGSLVYIKNKAQRASTDPDSSVVLQAILYRHINGTNTGLQATLTSASVIPSTPPTGASATLYTLSASNAIQTARIAVINAVKLLVAHKFNNGDH